MKLMRRAIAMLLCLAMTFTAMPAYALSSLLDNSPEHNQELLAALEDLVGSEDEARSYYTVLENYGLLDADGNFVTDMKAVIDGEEYDIEELCELLSGEYDGNSLAQVDGQYITLDNLWNIIVIEGYLQYLREEYFDGAEWTAEHEDSFESLRQQLAGSGLSFGLAAEPVLVGDYSGVNHGAYVAFKAGKPDSSGLVTVTADLYSAESGQQVSFDYQALSGSAGISTGSGSISMTADENGTATASFTVSVASETEDTLLIQTPPVWYLNVSGMKNALCEVNDLDAASYIFQGRATVGSGKTLTSLLSKSGLLSVDFADAQHSVSLSGNLAYYINHGFVNTVSETALLSTGEWNRNCSGISQSGGTYSYTLELQDDSGQWHTLLDNSVYLSYEHQQFHVDNMRLISPQIGQDYQHSADLTGLSVSGKAKISNSVPPFTAQRMNFEFSDTTIPQVTDIYVPAADYIYGQLVPVIVEFSEPVQADYSYIYINGVGVEPAETGISNRLSFPYPVKELDSVYPVAEKLTTMDAFDNVRSYDIKLNPSSESGSKVLTDAKMISCLPVSAVESFSADIDYTDPKNPVLKAKLVLCDDDQLTAWVASDLDQKSVCPSICAAIGGAELQPFVLDGTRVAGGTLYAELPLQPVETGTVRTVEVYISGALAFCLFESVTQQPMSYISSGDLSASVVVKAADGGFYQYADEEEPVIYIQDAPSVKAYFSLAEGGFTYSDTSSVTVLGADGLPMDVSADFAWASSDRSIANIDKDGSVYPTGTAGSVSFILYALNGDFASKSVSTETLPVSFGTGLSPFLMIPSRIINASAQSDVAIFWSSNALEKDENASYTVSVTDGSGDQVYFEEGIRETGIVIPGSALKYNYEEGADNHFTVEVSCMCANVELKDSARIMISSAPAVIRLAEPSSYYFTDSEGSVDISWTVDNFDRYSADNGSLFRLLVTRGSQVVLDSSDAGSGLDGSYSGSVSISPADVITSSEPSSYRDVYTVSAQAKNGPDSTWSYASFVFYVYDENALKIWVEGSDADSVEFSNVPRISEMSQEEILALKRDISLKTMVSANYGEFAWNDLSDRIEWKSSDASVSKLNYSQGSGYAGLENYSYTSYRPATSFMLSGLSDGDATITASHLFTGISDSLEVSVDTLKDQLYLFSVVPSVQTRAYYTNGRGEEKTAVSNEDGEFAVYEESGIASDVFFTSVSEGYSYYGTIFKNSLSSGEKDPVELELYPCNNLVLRRAAYATVYLKDGQGRPFTDAVTFRGGVYVNGIYQENAMFGFAEGQPVQTDGTEDCSVTPDSSGRLTVFMDSTQWDLGPSGLSQHEKVEYRFILQPQGSTEYFPLYICIDASANEESYLRSGEAVRSLRLNRQQGEHPFVFTQMMDVLDIDGEQSRGIDILDYTGAVGVSPEIREADITVSVLWWGDENSVLSEHSMSLLTDKRYQIAENEKTVEDIKLPFADYAITTLSVPFTEKTAKTCEIGPEPENLVLCYEDTTAGISYREDLSFRIADTTHTLIDPDDIEDLTEDINDSLDMTTGEVFGSLDIGDKLMKLFLEQMADEGYKPDKQHTTGFSLQIQPTKDPTVYRGYLALGIASMRDDNVTGVYASGENKSQFMWVPGLREVGFIPFNMSKKGWYEYAGAYGDDVRNVRDGKLGYKPEYNVSGYLETRIYYDKDLGSWKAEIRSGGFDAGFGLTVIRYFNTMVGPVPVTAELRGGGTAQVSLDTLTIRYLSDIENGGWMYSNGNEFLTQFRVYAYIKAFGGIGFDYSAFALKIGIYGQINFDLTCQWLNRSYMASLDNPRYADGSEIADKSKVMSGQHITIDGQVGIEFIVSFLWLRYEQALYSYPFNAYKVDFNDWKALNDQWKSSQEQFEKQMKKLLELGAARPVSLSGESMVMLDLAPTMPSLAYLQSGPDRAWHSDSLASGGAGIMQTNANPYSEPVLSDDGRILIYLSDETGGDNILAAYALKGDEGYEDKGIICGLGSGDSSPDAAGTAGFAVAAWSSLGDPVAKDAGSVVTAQDQIVMLESSEIRAAIWDGKSWSTQALTDNGTADIAPVAAACADRALVAWRSVATSNVGGNIADFNLMDTILYRIYDKASGEWSSVHSLYNGSSGCIKGLNAAMLDDGTAAIIYTLDTDGNDLSSEDREILWAVIGSDGNVSRTVQATSDSCADENPQICAAAIGGEPCFVAAWYSTERAGDSLIYDINLADLGTDGVMKGRLPRSVNRAVESGLLISPDFRLTKNADSVEDLALVWTERIAAETEGLTTENDILNSVRFYTYGGRGELIGMTMPQQVAEAPESTLIDSFDAAADGDRVIAVFEGTTYDPEKTVEKTGQTVDGDVVIYMVPESSCGLYTASAPYTGGVSINAVRADQNGLRCGASTIVSVSVENTGCETIESIELSLDGQLAEFEDLGILPADRITLHAEYRVPEDTVSDISCTVNARTAAGSYTANTIAAFGKPDLQITSAQIAQEALGRRDIEIKLYNSSDSRLVVSGRTVDIGFFSDSTCETPIEGISSVSISDYASLRMIDEGGYSCRVSFDASEYLGGLASKPEEIPEGGIPIYIKAVCLKDGEECAELSTVGNTESVICENLYVRTGKEVSVQSYLKTQADSTTVTARLRNNRLSETTTGNIIVTLYDAQGNTIDRMQSYDPALADSGLASIAGEDTLEELFIFDQPGCYAEVVYTDAVLDDPSDANLDKLEATNLPGISLAAFEEDTAQPGTFRASANAEEGLESVHIILSASDPGAAVSLNGEAVDESVDAALAKGQNQLDFAVTSRDGSTVCHYILSIFRDGSYTVCFDTGGKCQAPEALQVAAGQKAARPQDPAAEGMTFGGWYKDADYTELYDFESPVSSDITLYAKWTEPSPVDPVDPPIDPVDPPVDPQEDPAGDEDDDDSGNGSSGPSADFPFTDVEKDAWSRGDIEYVWARGLMQGMSDTVFKPGLSTTRAMIVTILWRLEGEPYVNYAMRFEDVKADMWYTEAVRWANAAGIVEGYSAESFGPEDNVTREQLAAIFNRYAEYKGLADPGRADLSVYEDKDRISGWAEQNMAWANAAGLINGVSPSLLRPEGDATREQLAAILHRFCEKYGL